MNTLPATEGLAPPPAEKTLSAISRLIRRVHMFSALFLMPWITMPILQLWLLYHGRNEAASARPRELSSLASAERAQRVRAAKDLRTARTALKVGAGGLRREWAVPWESMSLDSDRG